MNNKHSWQIPALLFALSFILRLLFISKGPYHIDCLTLALNAQMTLEKHQLFYQFGSGYPLTVLSAAFFVWLENLSLIADPVWAVNWMSAVFSSLAVAALYLLVKKLFDQTAAIWAALLLSFNPLFLSLSVYGNSHTVSIFYLILSLYLLARRDLFLFSLVFGLFGASRLQDMFLMLPAVFLLFWALDKKDSRSKCLTFIKLILGSFLITLLLHLPYLLGAGSKNYISQLNHFYYLGFVSNFIGDCLKRLFMNAQYLTIIASGAVFCIAICLFSFKDKRPSITGFLLSWILVPFLFYGTVLTGAPRFFLISLVPMIIFEGYMLAQFLKIKNRLYKTLLISFMLALTVIPLVAYTLPVLQFRHTHALLPGWALLIKDRTEPQARIIASDDNFVIQHYSGREFMSHPLSLKSTDQEELKKFKNDLDDTIERTPVYITLSGLIKYDPNGIFEDFIKNNYNLRPCATSRSEDWHNGELKLDIIDESLWQILPKH